MTSVTTFISDPLHVIARKDHLCDICSLPIALGDRYAKWSVCYDGIWNHIKAHDYCEKLASSNARKLSKTRSDECYLPFDGGDHGHAWYSESIRELINSDDELWFDCFPLRDLILRDYSHVVTEAINQLGDMKERAERGLWPLFAARDKRLEGKGND